MTNKIEKSSVQEIFELNTTQKGMLFHYLEDVTSNLYNIQLAFEIKGELEISLLKEAIEVTQSQNEALRSVFRWEELSKPVQIVLKQCKYSFETHDLIPEAEGKKQDLLQKLIEEDKVKRFDLNQLALRFNLIKTGTQTSVLLISFHHILFDGWSNGILLKELFSNFRKLSNQEACEIRPKVSYKEIQKKLTQNLSKKQDHEFWESYLENYELVSFIPESFNQQGEKVHSTKLKVSAPIAELNAFVKANNVTKAAVLYAAYGIILQKYGNTSDVVFGTTVANRDASIAGIQDVMGNFINTLPFRLEDQVGKTLAETVQEVHTSLINRGEYNHSSYADIKKLHRLKPHENLFDSVLVLENYPLEKEQIQTGNGVEIKLNSFYESTDVPLLITLFVDEELILEFSFNKNIVSESFVERLSGHLLNGIHQIITNPSTKVESFSLLTEAEKEQLLHAFNDTQTAYPKDKNLIELFEQQVLKTPDSIAIIDKDRSLSFFELQQKSNQLARTILQKGIEPEDIIGIMMTRRLEMLVSMLAVLKTGAAYLPLDPDFPLDRIEYMAENSDLSILLSESSLQAVYTQLNPDMEVIDVLNEDIYTTSTEDLQLEIAPTNLAYLIYTSGSTGLPKGIMIEHKSVINYAKSVARNIKANKYHSILCLTTMSFDIFVTETFLPLLEGLTVVLANSEDQKDPLALNNLIVQHQVDLMQITPSHLNLLLNGGQFEFLNCLKGMLVGGEGFPQELFKKLKSQFSGKIYNMYGPTETTVWSSMQDLSESSTVDIGKPLANTSIYILDKNQQLQAIGVPGELCIGGDGLARAYWKREELTNEKFIENPYSSGERIYRTGDLAKWQADGNLNILGRLDNQVKIRGFRIELGEIESQLISHELIKEAAAVVKENKGNKYIAAYYVAEKEIPFKELKDYLSGKLPNYMLPSYSTKLDSLPLTPNGKINRKVLPNPVISISTEFLAPSGETEEKLTQIWSEILGHKNISTQSNFFDIGGDSLSLISAASKIKQSFKKEVLINDLFTYPTISSLSVFLNGGVGENQRKSKKAQAKSSEKSNQEQTSSDIAIVGIAGRFPGAANLEEFWHKLKEGEEGIVRQGSQDKDGLVKAKGHLAAYDHFDAAFFDYTPREAEIMDPQIRIFHECVYEGLENAGYNSHDYEGRIGLYGGATANPNYNLNVGEKPSEDWIEKWDELTYADKDFLCPRISYKLNLQGPSLNISTACSTSLVAVDQACNDLLMDKCEMAIAGGVSVTLYDNEGYYYRKDMIMSPDGRCRAFDKNSAGTVGGNGAGVVVLKKLEDALRDGDYIHAVIKGTAINNDGRDKVGFTAPSITGQAQVIEMALENAQVPAESIGYVETHGTGTALGDPIEIAALTKAFDSSKKQFCAIGSVKTNIGHLDAAAGIAGLIKTVLALKHKQIPPSLHFSAPNPNIDFNNSPFFVNADLNQWSRNGTPRRAGVSSFGIGGTNAHVILEEAPAAKAHAESKPFQVLTISAKTEKSLEQNIERTLEYLQNAEAKSLADIAFTLNATREAYIFRKAIVCQDKKQAVELLEKAKKRKAKPISNKKKQNIFMFPGLGSQYKKMFADLYGQMPYFQSIADECFKIYRGLTGVNLKVIIFSDSLDNKGVNELDHVEYAHPSLFIMEYALAKLFMSWGIHPDIMIGHSIGEYVAACLSGVFSLEDAISIVTKRSQLIQECPGGSMLGISIAAQDLTALLKNQEDLSLAAVNGPELCLVSGSVEAIQSFQEIVAEKGYAHQLVKAAHASHSHMMDEVLPAFEKEIRKIEIHPPQRTFISNVTGKIATFAEIKDPNYWVRHLRETVRFSEGVKPLLANPDSVFIELGPGNVLGTFVRSNPQISKSHKVIYPVRHEHKDAHDLAYLLQSLGKLWVAGVAPNWERFYQDEKRSKLPLPTYAFDSIPYPVRRSSDVSNLGEHLSKAETFSDYLYTPSWEIANPVSSFIPQKNICTLMFSDEHALSGGLKKKFSELGERIIEVKAGATFKQEDSYSFEINLDSEEDYLSLFQAIGQHSSYRMLFTWGLDKETSGYTNQIETQQKVQKYFYSLLNISKAITEQGISPVELISISNNTNYVLNKDLIAPEKSTLLGALKVIPKEYSHISCRNIDIVWQEEVQEEIIEEIFQELGSDEKLDSVAYRYHTRFKESFQKLELRTKKAEKLPLKKEGVYLITGGIGGIGLSLAQKISQQFEGIKLVLFSRRVLPEKRLWNEYLSRPKNGNASTYEAVSALRKLEEQGAKVFYHSVDIANEKELTHAVKAAELAFGKIEGIIHTAGIADYAGIIHNRTQEENEKVFAAKIYGTLLLNKVFKENKLDFFVLCSSISSVIASEGQVGYAAANKFLDAFARYNSTVNQVNTLSIAWNAWREVGFATKISNTDELDEISKANSISPDEGYQILLEVLKHQVPEMIISTFDLAELKQRASQYEDKKAEEELVEVFGDSSVLQDKMWEIWRNLLGVTDIELEDDFFDIGGNSLKALTLIGRIRKVFHVDISIKEFFNHSSIKNLSEYISQLKELNTSESQILTVPKAEIKSHYPLSSGQNRLYFLYEFDKDSLAYNIPIAYELVGKLDTERLQDAFRKLIDRQESLRTQIKSLDRIPFQEVLEKPVFEIEHFDKKDQDLKEALRVFIRPFELGQAPLFRVGVFSLEEERKILMIDMHHVISDGVSEGILMTEFMAIYNGEELPEMSLQYKDYAEWQKTDAYQEKIESQKEFWLNEFKDEVQVLNLPTDFSRPPVLSFEGNTLPFELEESSNAKFNALVEKERLTPFILLLSIYNIFLSKLGNQEDVVIGTHVANRQHPDFQGMIGMFVNTLALRNYPKGDLSVKDFLSEVKAKTLSCFDKQSYPYEDLIDELNLGRDTSRNALFNVAIVFYNTDNVELKIPGLSLSPHRFEHKVSKFDLTLIVNEKDGKLLLNFEYCTKLFKQETVERFISYFKKLVDVVMDNIDISIAQINILSEDEKQALTLGFNDTFSLDSEDKTLVDLFEEQVKTTPDNLALVDKSGSLTYAELNEKSNQLARRIKRYQVKKEDIIGIMLPRTQEMIISILGILKAGCAYLPLDPDFPSDRIDYMAENSGMSLLLSDPSSDTTFSELETKIEVLDVTQPDIYTGNSDNLNLSFSASNLAYLIYTSGSTGKPKGIMIEHKSVANYVEGVSSNIQIEDFDSILCLTTMSFDIFVTETFMPLLKGLKIVLADGETQKDPKALNQLIVDQEVDLMQITPSHMNLLLLGGGYDFLSSVKSIMVGGEAFPEQLFMELKEKFKGKIYNMYGPTETTVWSTMQDLTDKSSVDIGKPIRNTQIYILDKYGSIQATGVPGELCIGGSGLARGYWKNKPLTEEKFINSPYLQGKRLYRTGDLASWTAEGVIKYLGRMDNQVKIRGFRIELGEIENKLNTHAQVEKSVLIAKEKAGNKYLVAYYLAEEEVSVSELRNHLSKALPDYMIPSYFVKLEAFPLTPNGKIDRKSLPEPKIEASKEYVAPSNEEEEKLTEVWAEILDIDKSVISIHKSFFELGGDSLKIIQLNTLINETFDWGISVPDLFRYPSIKLLTEYIVNRDLVSAQNEEEVMNEVMEMKNALDNLFKL